MLLLTPTGSLPSPCWRPLARVAVVAPVVGLATSALGAFDPPYRSVHNPLSVEVVAWPLQALNLAGWVVTGLMVPVAAASLIVRFRRACGAERLQLRWLVLAAGPRSCASGCTTWTGTAGQSPTGCSRCCSAAAFQPVRRCIQRAVDRRFDRRRHDTAHTIGRFSARLHQQIDLDTLTGELLAVVDQTMQPTHVSLWLEPRRDAGGAAPRAATGGAAPPAARP